MHHWVFLYAHFSKQWTIYMMLKNCDLWQHRPHKLSSSSLQIFSLVCGSGHCWPGPGPLAGSLLSHPPTHSVSVSLHLPALVAASQRTTRALSSLTLIIIYASVVRWGFTRIFSLSCDLFAVEFVKNSSILSVFLFCAWSYHIVIYCGYAWVNSRKRLQCFDLFCC